MGFMVFQTAVNHMRDFSSYIDVTGSQRIANHELLPSRRQGRLFFKMVFLHSTRLELSLLLELELC